MLVLNRKIGESFTIDGDIKIIILGNHGIVRLGIDAPKYKRIIRDDHDNLSILLNPVGMIALRKKLITPEQATIIPELDILLNEKNTNIILAMELGLLSPSDFEYRGNLSFWGNNSRPKDMIKYTNDLIDKHHRESPLKPKLEKSAITLQSYWRGYRARKKFGIFKEISTLLQSGQVAVKDLHNLDGVLKLAENDKLKEAQEQLAKMRKCSPL